MVEDGCDSSPAQTCSPPPITQQRPMGWGVLSLIVNSCLLLPFGLRLLGHGVLIEGYLFVLGFPATLLLYFSPDVATRDHPSVFVVFYIVNFVVVSYCLGTFLSWVCRRVFARSLVG